MADPIDNQQPGAADNQQPGPANPQQDGAANPQQLLIYHEKQQRQLCALHALNNLFQDPKAFTKEELDAIAHDLNTGFFNSHRSALGLGNYDIAVIEKALATRNYSFKWFNRNKNFTDLRLENIFGFIINIPNKTNIFRMIITLGNLATRHWIAVKLIYGLYVNLDSKMEGPQDIGDAETLAGFIAQKLAEDSQVLIVMTDEVEADGSWKNANY